MGDQKEDFPKKEVPKKEDLKQEVPKKEAPKKEAPKEEVLEEQIPESEVPKKGVLKKEGRKKRWRLGYTITILAAVLGALVTVILTEVIKQREILPPLPQETAKEQFDRAIRLREQGAYSEALKVLEELISEHPDYIDAYNIKGRIYVDNLKQYQNAENEFKRGLKKDPKHKYMLYNLGLAYYWLGDLKQAISWNDSALAQDQDLIIAIYNGALYRVDYGERYNDESAYPDAIQLYEIVINRDLEFAAAAMFNLAALYAKFARRENNQIVREQYINKAIGLLDRSIERDNKEGKGPERLKKITGEISVPYGKNLEILYPYPAYKAMTKRWKESFTN
jgi:tetratricopeptide (TPR) repeat protein